MHHSSVHARRQRLPIVHVGGAVQVDRELQEQDSEERTQEGDAIQDASRRGNRPLAPSRHRSQNLRAHQGLLKARRRGLGKEGVRLQQEELILPSLEPKESPRCGKQKHRLHRDTIAPASPAFKALFVARYGTAVVGCRRRQSGQRLHIIRRLTAGCKRLHRCSELHRQHSR